MSPGKDVQSAIDALVQFEAGLISRETAVELIRSVTIELKEPPLPTKSRAVSPVKGPPNAYLKDGLRYYPWQGQQLMSVTSLRQQVGLPSGLVKWMQRQVAERAVYGIKDLTNMVMAGDDTDGIIDWLVAGGTEKRDAAGNRGSAIHEHVAAGGGVMAADVAIRPFVENYETAMHNLLIEPLLIERQVFSPSMGYAGSFDMIAHKDGEVTLIDLKTGGSLYIDNALQLAGYVLADFIGQDDVIDEEATRLLHSVTALGLLHVTDTGFDYVPVPLTPVLGDAFRSQLTLAKFYAKHPTLGDLTGKDSIA
jgi:hypothetical protein